ncbi:hypothetical protein CkaCkLH20_00974 [Colletotrichum karsti]|uniref:Uncharacterized protein n=1 Tax=Colletotrichum karsti TaxID=1095194 RepID=A0A9P6IE25_9PEZI|nr:uncharacterized protein CkaCkLH20_00974 [Colletotrichum karsti]KAF9881828.1 hypothetical protein CkaCkLH20_00974 [Colletotrichum karsti]
MELFADEVGSGSEGPAARPRPLRVLKRLGNRDGQVGGRYGTTLQLSSETNDNESQGSGPEEADEPLVVMKKRVLRGTASTDNEGTGTNSNDIRGFDIDRNELPLSSYDGHHLTTQPCNRRQLSDPFSDPIPTQEAAILVPRIIVTPSVKAIEGSRGSMWVAIEVSAELSRPPNVTLNAMDLVLPGGSKLSEDGCRELGDRYGCIYDMNIQLIPVGNNCILEMIQEDEPTPTMIFLGLKVLVLANIHFEPQGPVPFKPNGHIRQRSDELIDDLENQLGSSRVEYLRIVVTYKHSAFPKHDKSDPVDGVADTASEPEQGCHGATTGSNSTRMVRAPEDFGDDMAEEPRGFASTGAVFCNVPR